MTSSTLHDGSADEDAADGEDDATDRRVELFFFDGGLGVQPPPGGDNSAEGSAEYPEWRARAKVVEDYRAGVAVPIFDWDASLDAGMPANTTLTLRDEGHEMTIAWRDGAVSGTRRRFVFGELSGDLPCTLVATIGGEEYVLLEDQQITATDHPVQWSLWLEDLVELPDPLGEFEVAGAMPSEGLREFEGTPPPP